MIKLPVSPIAMIATGLILGVTSVAAALFSGVETVRGDTRSLTGVVESVWEDGFRLRADNRSIITDTWDVCGDFTARHVRVGDRLTVVGEYEGREFDVFQITNANGQQVCR
ncbi:MAG: hypothetical protein EAZ87_24575 [Nostocales cyanobacterium]|nr:MAG: hypothetical protein EAZ87_24575 [Nostocales cyanobacterium]